MNASTRRRRSPLWALLIALVFPVGCGDPPPPPPGEPGSRLPRRGDEIAVCGQLFHTATRVVLWNDPGGYDAYRAHCHFTPEKASPRQHPARLARFDSFRGGLSRDLGRRVRREGWRLEDLKEVVSLVVLHYDACGTSRKCFEVLHDDRGLSTHFMVDLDGTVYQTLDLKERAWHAAEANDRSIGIEIAHIGARVERPSLQKHYKLQDGSLRFVLPEREAESFAGDFVPRPSRPGLFEGEIHGKELVQYDFTEEQYVALEKLLLTLCRIFPKIEPRAPLDEDGEVLMTLPGGERGWRDHCGLLGHFHVTRRKIDPGPAFDWKRILEYLQEHAR